MKKYNNFLTVRLAAAFAAVAALTFASLYPDGSRAQNAAEDFAGGQADLSAAQKDLQKAEKNFQEAGKHIEKPASGTAAWSETQLAAPAAQPERGQSPRKGAAQQGVEVLRNVAPGYDGFMGTYVDPENGDIVTSVIAPTNRNQQQQYQNYPIIVEPQVGAWGDSGWNGNWNYDRNNGWQGPGQQVPGYPWPPAGPGFQPSGQVPGYPWPPAPEGYGPPPPYPGTGVPGNPGNFPPQAGNMPGPPPPPPGANGPLPPNVGNPGGLYPPGAPGNNPGGWPSPPGAGNNQGFMPTPPFPNAPEPNVPGMNVPGGGFPAPPGQPQFPPGPGAHGAQRPGMRPSYAPPAVPGQNGSFAPGRPGNWRPGAVRPPMGRPHSELAPPRNPGRPGSMPLVSPNFPPHVEQKPFADLYRPPAVRASRAATAAAAAAASRQEASSYYVPGSAQSWQPSNWQPGK